MLNIFLLVIIYKIFLRNSQNHIRFRYTACYKLAKLRNILNTQFTHNFYVQQKTSKQLVHCQFIKKRELTSQTIPPSYIPCIKTVTPFEITKPNSSLYNRYKAWSIVTRLLRIIELSKCCIQTATFQPVGICASLLNKFNRIKYPVLMSVKRHAVFFNYCKYLGSNRCLPRNNYVPPVLKLPLIDHCSLLIFPMITRWHACLSY